VYFDDRTGCSSHRREETLAQGRWRSISIPNGSVTTTLTESDGLYPDPVPAGAADPPPARDGESPSGSQVAALLQQRDRAYDRRLAAYLEEHTPISRSCDRRLPAAATQFMQMCQASLYAVYLSGRARTILRAHRASSRSATRMFLAGYQRRISDSLACFMHELTTNGSKHIAYGSTRTVKGRRLLQRARLPRTSTIARSVEDKNSHAPGKKTVRKRIWRLIDAL